MLPVFTANVRTGVSKELIAAATATGKRLISSGSGTVVAFAVAIALFIFCFVYGHKRRALDRTYKQVNNVR